MSGGWHGFPNTKPALHDPPCFVSSKFPPVIIVSGASGSGKTSLCRKAALELGLYYSVSYTTRPQREREVEGRDYHFITQSVFDRMIQRGEFLEWASVYGHCYGTSKKLIDDHLQKGVGVILDVDTKGAQVLRKKIADVFLVFVKAPSLEELKTRLSKRGSENAESLKRRLQEALKEEGFIGRYDRVIVNARLREAASELVSLIQSRYPRYAQT